MLQRTFHLYQRAYKGLSPSVWLLAGVMLINRCGTMVLPFMTLYLTQHLHYSVQDTGIVMGIYGLGAFVGTFLGGRLTDRFGFYYVQLFSLLFSGMALIGLQFVTHFYALCGSVFVFTLFGDAFRPANQAAIAHYSEAENRTRAFSLNRLAINLGWSVGGGLGGLIAGISYNLLFWTDGLTCLAAGIVLWIFLPVPASQSVHEPSRTDDQPVVLTKALSPYRDKWFVAFVICSCLYLMAFMQLFSIVPLFFKEVMQMNVGTIGLLTSLNGMIIVLIEMTLVYNLERQNWSKINLIVVGVILTSASYATLALTNWMPVSYMAIALVFIIVGTFSEMLAIPFIQSFTVERASPATRGQYLALASMSGALAQTLSPAIGSQIVALFGFAVHWLVIAGISLLSAGGFWLLGKTALRRQFSEIDPVA